MLLRNQQRGSKRVECSLSRDQVPSHPLRLCIHWLLPASFLCLLFLAPGAYSFTPLPATFQTISSNSFHISVQRSWLAGERTTNNRLPVLRVKNDIDGIYTPEDEASPVDSEQKRKGSDMRSMVNNLLQRSNRPSMKPPPLQVDDTSLLFCDVFLILNLVVSISFFVTHRMSLDFIFPALSEGCLLSILWIVAGLYHGTFLYSAIDGHYASGDERGGYKGACLLALNTFLNTMSLRLMFALVAAATQHREVGAAFGEQMIPLEMAFGIVLMSTWRALHSSVTPRF